MLVGKGLHSSAQVAALKIGIVYYTVFAECVSEIYIDMAILEKLQ